MTSRFTAFEDSRDEVLRRFRQSDRSATANFTLDNDFELFVSLDGLPDDGSHPVNREVAKLLLLHDFEEWVVLGDYQGIYDPKARVAEFRIDYLASEGSILSTIQQFVGLLGGFTSSEIDAEVTSQVEKIGANQDLSFLTRSSWRLDIRGASDQKYAAEINSGSARSWLIAASGLSSHEAVNAAYLGGNLASIQLSNLEGINQDPKIATLEIEELLWKIIFELQVSHKLALELQHRPKWRPIGNLPGISRRPALTENRYSRDALSLFVYARTATATPAYQYLTYYRVLESYFTRVVNDQAVKIMQRKISDPSFTVRDRDRLAELAVAIQSNNPQTTKEDDQLEMLLSQRLDLTTIEEYLRTQGPREFFADPRKLGGEIPQIRLGNATPSDLPKQLATRVYKVRNRVAHAKGGRSEKGEWRKILPFTPESKELHHDIELVKLLAQRALIDMSIPQ